MKEIDKIFKFVKEASKGLKKGERKRFTCPLCNEDAEALKSKSNGHLHAVCSGCGYSIHQ